MAKLGEYHILCTCHSCDFYVDDYETGFEDIKKHIKETKHEMSLEIGLSVSVSNLKHIEKAIR